MDPASPGPVDANAAGKPERDRWLRPRAEQGPPARSTNKANPWDLGLRTGQSPRPSSPPLPGKQELFLGPGPARETHPEAPNPLCAAGTWRRPRVRCNWGRGGLQAADPAPRGRPSLRAPRPPSGVCLGRDTAAGFPRREACGWRPPTRTPRTAAARRRARGRGSRGRSETKARRPLVDDAGAWSSQWPGPLARALGSRSTSPAGRAPTPARCRVPGRGDPARLSAPAAPRGSPPGSASSSLVGARGPPGPRKGRDDPCWREQWRLPSPAPPGRPAPSTLGPGAPREFAGDLEEQPELGRCRAVGTRPLC